MVFFEDRPNRTSSQTIGGAIDMDRIRARGDGVLVKVDAVESNLFDMTRTNYVPDPAQLVQFELSDRAASKHRRADSGI